jgi:hypothetical protein
VPSIEGPERAHLWLSKSVGTWTVKGLYYLASDTEPVEASGIERIEMFGPYWRRGHVEIDLLGSIVRGCTCVGFDPLTQVFLGTWFDTSNPYLYAYRGRYDENTSALVLTGSNTDPATGGKATYRSVEWFDLPERRKLELFVRAKGRPEAKIFTYDFERTEEAS